MRSTTSRRAAPTAATTLNVTFALGTDPDIDTVNVQNRAQLALAAAAAGSGAPALPSARSRRRCCRSSALLAQEHLRLALSEQLRHDQRLDRCRAISGVGQATLFGPLDYSLRHLARHRPPHRVQPDAERRHRGRPESERPGGLGRHRRGAGRKTSSRFSSPSRPQGRLASRTSSPDRPARQSRRFGRPDQGRRPRRDSAPSRRTATAGSTARRRRRSASTSRPAPMRSTWPTMSAR